MVELSKSKVVSNDVALGGDPCPGNVSHVLGLFTVSRVKQSVTASVLGECSIRSSLSVNTCLLVTTVLCQNIAEAYALVDNLLLSKSQPISPLVC
jgi:hypothetical protein